ncbi:UbiA family prenyltransferase [Roseivirga sp.]|uniref:UbiA family prenyltransferase n=1 Tax=Roseivirga sp. TaxID=1964215 RepID=UPI002B27BB7F|nr:UbiA family prenyltransferase [Roseivirga sp.]
MRKLLILIQNLSLDVTAGAIICSLYVAKLLGVRLESSMLIGLGVAIWLIYTIDHLFDAKKGSGSSTNQRHAFHHKYFKQITYTALGIFIVGVVNLYYLPWVTTKLGLILALLVLIYIGSLHLLKLNKTWHKEFLAAIIYSFGVFVAPLSLLAHLDPFVFYIFMVFFLIVLSNLLVFPVFEHESDRSNNIQSIVTIYGNVFVRKLTIVILVFNVLLIVGGIVYLNPVMTGARWLSSEYILFVMTLVLAMLLIFPSFFQRNDRYRLAGDGIFFFPLIYILL